MWQQQFFCLFRMAHSTSAFDFFKKYFLSLLQDRKRKRKEEEKEEKKYSKHKSSDDDEEKESDSSSSNTKENQIKRKAQNKNLRKWRMADRRGWPVTKTPTSIKWMVHHEHTCWMAAGNTKQRRQQQQRWRLRRRRRMPRTPEAATAMPGHYGRSISIRLLTWSSWIWTSLHLTYSVSFYLRFHYSCVCFFYHSLLGRFFGSSDSA